jgi:methyltransferase (TIGR00027 family)
MRGIGLSRLIGVEGMINFALLRERHIEELMRAEARDGIEQVVILGAGFDTRAYRMAELGARPVYEVDHPQTQAAKRAALQSVVDPLPANVRMVAVDFNHDDLGERLRAAGYDRTKRTLFVWQGVIMYLTPEGVAATLGFIAKNSAAGSVLVFDYLYTGGVSGAAPLRLMTGMMGEALTFSLEKGTVGPYLRANGLWLVEDVDGESLGRAYFGARRRPIAAGAAIAIARVPG